MNLLSTDFNITFISYINKRKHFESIHPLKKNSNQTEHTQTYK